MVVDVDDIFTSSNIFKAGFELGVVIATQILLSLQTSGTSPEMVLVFLGDDNQRLVQGIRLKNSFPWLQRRCALRFRFTPRSFEFLGPNRLKPIPNAAADFAGTQNAREHGLNKIWR